MATAAILAALDQQAVIDAFMRSDAVRPAQAIIFEPKGAFQRGFFRNFTKVGIIKQEGARWYLDVPAYSAAKRSQRKKAIAVADIQECSAPSPLSLRNERRSFFKAARLLSFFKQANAFDRRHLRGAHSDLSDERSSGVSAVPYHDLIALLHTSLREYRRLVGSRLA